MNKALVITESAYFKAGEIIEGKVEKGEFLSKKHCIAEGDYILLEKLNSQDEEQVRKIIRDMMKRMLWRLYTRADFIVKEERK